MLKQIVAKKRDEVAAAKERQPEAGLRQQLKPGNFRLSAALAASDWSLIAECKLASPVKGRFDSGRSVDQLAAIYETNGATAISVLTDRHFDGTAAHVPAVRQATDLPILRKDFIIDSYQLYEARVLGADAILLIAAVLTDGEINRFLAQADEIGLDCLVEVHDEEELRRVLATPARLIGINNRNLHTFTTDIATSLKLLPLCGPDRLIISESGIRTAEDALKLKEAGAKGILAGEHLVTAGNIAAKTRELTLRQEEIK